MSEDVSIDHNQDNLDEAQPQSMIFRIFKNLKFKKLSKD